MTGRNTETIQLDPLMLVMNASLMTNASGEMSRITRKFPSKKESLARWKWSWRHRRSTCLTSLPTNSL